DILDHRARLATEASACLRGAAGARCGARAAASCDRGRAASLRARREPRARRRGPSGEMRGRLSRAGGGSGPTGWAQTRQCGLVVVQVCARCGTVAVGANAAGRPLVLNLLLDSSDASVVDLSDGGSWALAAIQAEGVAQRCVFVALWGRLEEAETALRAAGL